MALYKRRKERITGGFRLSEKRRMEHFLHLKALLPVQALNAGYLVTKGRGRHVERTMDTFEFIYVYSGTLGIFE